MQTTNELKIEKWKMDLILEIARRKGFRRDELDDAQQHAVLSIIHFKFDPQKANGAKERTVLAWHIERVLTQVQRTDVRRKDHAKKIHRVCGSSKFQPTVDDTQLEHERRFEIGVDVRDTVSEMTPTEQAVCQSLSLGIPRCKIAAKLRVSRYEVERIIESVREQFVNIGLDSI